MTRSRSSPRIAGDFCDDKELHPDLIADVTSRGLSCDKIAIFDSLDSYIAVYVKPVLEELESIKGEILEGRYRGVDLIEPLTLQLQTWLETMDLEPEELGFPHQFDEPSISSIEHLSIQGVTGVHRLAPNEVLVTLVVEVDCEFDFFVLKADLYVFDDDDAPYVSDYNWNKHVVAASKSTSLTFAVSLTVDDTSGEITSLDVDENLTGYGDK